jgi:hypothetical protein
MSKFKRQLQKLGQKKILLNTVLFIFLGLSAVTTYLGADLVLNFDNAILQFAVSFSLAIGLSLLLLFLSKSISTFLDSVVGGILLLFSYTIVALLSVFFNFQTFYINLNKKSDVDSNSVVLRTNINKMSSKGYLENIALSSLQDSISLKKAEMDFELGNSSNPGEGPKFLAAEAKYLKYKSIYKDNERKFNRVFSEILRDKNSATKLLDSIQINQNTTSSFIQSNLLNKALDKYNSICANISSLNSTHECELVTIDKKDITSSLEVFMNIISGEKKFSVREQASIGLSVFLAAILDFPIFLLLVSIEFVNRTSSDNKNNGKNSKSGGRFSSRKGRNFDVKDLFNR